MTKQDFSDFSKRMERIGKLSSKRPPGAVLLVVISAVWAACAYYDHLVLVLGIAVLTPLAWWVISVVGGILKNNDEFLCAGLLAGLDSQEESARTMLRLRDALSRIDPGAVRSFEEIDKELREAQAEGQHHRSTYEPTVTRLQREVLRLRQEIEALRGNRPA